MAFGSFNYKFVNKISIQLAASYGYDYDDILDATQNTAWKTCCCDRSRRAWSAHRYEINSDFPKGDY